MSTSMSTTEFITQIYTTELIDHWNTDETVILEQKIQRWPALLSLLCSLYVLVDILRQPTERVKVVNRIIVALSLSDALYSFGSPFLGAWAAPKGYAWSAVGNEATCSAAAFFGGLGFYCSIYYNASLAICYLLMIRYAWREDKLRQVQWLLLLVPVAIVLPWCIMSLFWQGGNFTGKACGMMQAFPMFCDNQLIHCARGGRIVEVFWQNNGNTPRGWTLFVLPSIICGPIVVVCMVLLYWSVWQRESANDRYSSDGSNNRKHSKQVAYQGILYIWAYLAVEVPWVVGVALWAHGKNPSGLIAVTAVFMPLRGFWNALVYLRPRYWPLIKQHCCTCAYPGIKQQSTARSCNNNESQTRPLSVDTMTSMPSPNDEEKDLEQVDSDLKAGERDAKGCVAASEAAAVPSPFVDEMEGSSSELESGVMAAESMFLGLSNH